MKTKAGLLNLHSRLLNRTYFRFRKRRIIFVLSTGRCGSTSIVKMLNQNNMFLAFHECIIELIAISTRLAENPDQREQIYQELDIIFKNRFWEGYKGEVVVHSDHRLWNLVDFLSHYFPNSFFIHLSRNPLENVLSLKIRKWYTIEDNIQLPGKEFSRYRLFGDRIGAVPKMEWQNMSQMQKCIWYWDHVNYSIQQQLHKLEADRYLHLTLDNLNEGMNKKLKTIFDLDINFLFIEKISNSGPLNNEVKDEIQEEFETAWKTLASKNLLKYDQ